MKKSIFALKITRDEKGLDFNFRAKKSDSKLVLFPHGFNTPLLATIVF